MKPELRQRIQQTLRARKEAVIEWFTLAPPLLQFRVMGETAIAAFEPTAPGSPLPDVGSNVDLSIPMPPVVMDVEEALHRHDQLGQCIICGEDVETELVELDFTANVCLDHFSEAEQRELESDLELAAKVQRHLYPVGTPALSGVQIAAHTAPARIVSGDYYDFFRHRETGQGIAIADVMGKGISASMLMSNLQASLRILAEQYETIDDLASHLNRLFVHNLRVIRFITMFLVALDEEERKLRYCNAGHNPALFWEARTRSVSWLQPTGPAIGLMKDAPYSEAEKSYEPGDILVLYTDGLAEARNVSGSDLGLDAISHFVAAHSDADADQLLNGLWQLFIDHSNGRRRDDATVIVVKFD